MLASYLKIALRHLRRSPLYSFINVAGLGVGIGCCLLMLLFVRDELSYDRHHAHAGRIVRLADHLRIAGSAYDVATSPVPWGPALKDDFPEVREVVRLFSGSHLVPVLVRYEDRSFYEDRFFYADSTVFDVFTLPLVHGDAATALDAPGTVVVSERAAAKYFGGAAAALGRRLTLGDSTHFEVTGVMADPPATGHWRPDFVASFASLDLPYAASWTVHGPVYTYLLLADASDATRLEAEIPAFLRRRMGDELAARYTPELQPLTRIHLHSRVGFDFAPRGSATYVYLFGVLAAFILLLACVNFTNLMTARSAGRAREVGLRKVMGAGRVQLVAQHLGEAFVMAALAVGLGVVLAALGLPVLNDLTGKALAASELARPDLLAGIAGLALLVGLVAGSYPAFFLARFEPVRVLKQRTAGAPGGALLRKGLVVFQFTVSVALIAGTLVVVAQLDYLRSKELGFRAEQVLVLPMQGEALLARRDALKQALEQHPGVVQVGAASGVPGEFLSGLVYQPEGVAEAERTVLPTLFVDHGFLETLGVETAAGRLFSDAFASDSSAFVLNEAAVRRLGWADAVGRRFQAWQPAGQNTYELELEGPVVGVVRDFHVASLHQAIEPLVIRLVPQAAATFAVRVRPGQAAAVTAFAEGLWQRHAPERPFQYRFLDEQLAAQYGREERLARLFSYCAGLAVLVACLGLFGLAAFTAERRTREIGIRKVLGATVPGLMALLVRDFAALVGVALLVATPLAYLGMDTWLGGFAYRIATPWWAFGAAGALALAFALATVGYQAARAARVDPVKSLRYE